MPRTKAVWHLTHDECLSVVLKRSEHNFRLRIWHAHGEAPVALVSAYPGGPAPLKHATRIATQLRWCYFKGSTQFVFVEGVSRNTYGVRTCETRGPRLLVCKRCTAVTREEIESYLGVSLELEEKT